MHVVSSLWVKIHFIEKDLMRESGTINVMPLTFAWLLPKDAQAETFMSWNVITKKLFI
ncbi:MAG TPA: hypothetical protein VEV83_22455 [Parafilimonas sp.]|nr:hypothetical protein [Parafilimonas sp.]